MARVLRVDRLRELNRKEWGKSSVGDVVGWVMGSWASVWIGGDVVLLREDRSGGRMVSIGVPTCPVKQQRSILRQERKEPLGAIPIPKRIYTHIQDFLLPSRSDCASQDRKVMVVHGT